jgi:hypothetical protein
LNRRERKKEAPVIDTAALLGSVDLERLVAATRLAELLDT